MLASVAAVVDDDFKTIGIVLNDACDRDGVGLRALVDLDPLFR